MAALTLPPSLRVLGVLSAGPWAFDSFMIYGVVSTVLLGSLLRPS